MLYTPGRVTHANANIILDDWYFSKKSNSRTFEEIQTNQQEIYEICKLLGHLNISRKSIFRQSENHWSYVVFRKKILFMANQWIRIAERIFHDSSGRFWSCGHLLQLCGYDHWSELSGPELLLRVFGVAMLFWGQRCCLCQDPWEMWSF